MSHTPTAGPRLVKLLPSKPPGCGSRPTLLSRWAGGATALPCDESHTRRLERGLGCWWNHGGRRIRRPALTDLPTRSAFAPNGSKGGSDAQLASFSPHLRERDGDYRPV